MAVNRDAYTKKLVFGGLKFSQTPAFIIVKLSITDPAGLLTQYGGY